MTVNSSSQLDILPSSVMEYLSSFLPASDPSSDSEEISFLTSEDDSIRESWLLCYSLLVDLGICPQQFSLLLSWELYYFLSKHLLPVHLRPLKPGYTPPPNASDSNHKSSPSSLSPLHFELTSVCVNQSITLEADRSLPQCRVTKDPDEIAIIAAIDLLFPNLFFPSSAEEDTLIPTPNYQSTSLRNGCKLLQLLSILLQEKQSGLHDPNHVLAQCIDEGVRILEKGVSIFMVLLPRCSKTAKHSCCPSAHFNPCHDPLPTTAPTALNSLETMILDLPRSSGLRVSVVCLRDFICTCSLPPQYPPQCIGQCSSNSFDGLSISLAPESLPFDVHARQESFDHLTFSSPHDGCQCFRCLVETKGLEFTLREQFADTHSDLSHLMDHITEPSMSLVYLLLGLVYSWMANQKMNEARDVLEALLGSISKSHHKFPNNEITDSLVGRLTHALGATYLEQGQVISLLFLLLHDSQWFRELEAVS